MRYKLQHSLLLLFSLSLFAQEKRDTIEEVHVLAQFSPKLQTGYTINQLTDSILSYDVTELSTLLRKRSNIYIKEQGAGMLASISLRGTGASHTAVYWNGIPVNSSLNGQTDFNSFTPSLFNRLSIRKGGGSVSLGSGAIGGAINMENIFLFDKGLKAQMSTTIGSYTAFGLQSKASYSTDKLALQMGQSVFKSENDYPYLGTNLRNDNGQIHHSSLQYGVAYKYKLNQKVYFQSLTSVSDRNTSGTLTTSNTANLWYKTRVIMGGWDYKTKLLKFHLNSALIKEVYLYQFDKTFPNNVSDNRSQKWYNKLEIKHKTSAKLLTLVGITHEILKGKGSNIEAVKQHKTAIYAWAHHQLLHNFVYNISLRKAFSEDYNIPLLYAIDTRYSMKNHSIRANYSTNYKTPSLNDLYWDIGGNPDLLPENSHSFELGYLFEKFKQTKIEFQVYQIRNHNLIKWQPVSSSIWQPFNIQDVEIKGLELEFNKIYKTSKQLWEWGLQYSYTKSTDKSTGLQLLYVPYHLLHTNLDYKYKTWHASGLVSYTGKSYITATNTQYIPSYALIDVVIGKTLYHNKVMAIFTIKNLLNTPYQIVANRPMPNRNYLLQIHYKF